LDSAFLATSCPSAFIQVYSISDLFSTIVPIASISINSPTTNLHRSTPQHRF
jgi:hypothetical protein